MQALTDSNSEEITRNTNPKEIKEGKKTTKKVQKCSGHYQGLFVTKRMCYCVCNFKIANI